MHWKFVTPQLCELFGVSLSHFSPIASLAVESAIEPSHQALDEEFFDS